MNNLYKTLTFGVAMAFLCLVTVRSFTVPLTYDESYTAQIALGLRDPLIANNHILNTQLIRIFLELGFIKDELAIRAPSLIGAFIYAFFQNKIGKQITNEHSLRLFFAILFLANPIVIEFFSIGRGYALSMAFVSFAIFSAMKLISNTPPPRRRANHQMPQLFGIRPSLSYLLSLLTDRRFLFFIWELNDCYRARDNHDFIFSIVRIKSFRWCRQ